MASRLIMMPTFLFAVADDPPTFQVAEAGRHDGPLALTGSTCGCQGSATHRRCGTLLTAGTTMFGNAVITLAPSFSRLAWSIIFGMTSSTLYTIVVIPISYWLIYHDRTALTWEQELSHSSLPMR